MNTRVLVVAGNDSAGLSGIDADLKTFSAFGFQAMSVVTANTSQSTLVFESLGLRPVEDIRRELESVFEKTLPSVLKTGLLGSAAVVNLLADLLEQVPPSARPVLVVDPVLVSTSGGILLDEAGQRCLRERLLPLTSVVTPNAPEAAALCGGESPATWHDLENLAQCLLKFGPTTVYIKGGHLSGESVKDLLCSFQKTVSLPSARRIQGGPFRGTGCTLASALAAGLAQKKTMQEAAEQAQYFTAVAIQNAKHHHIYAALGYQAAARKLKL